MGYHFSQEKMGELLNELSKDFDLYGPTVQVNGGRFSDQDIIGYGKLSCIDELAFSEQSYFSPKEVVFPIRQTLFYFDHGSVKEPEESNRPILLFLRSCDIEGIKRLDTIFLNNGKEADVYYARFRERVKYVLLECQEGYDSCFCVSMNSNKATDYALAMRPVDGGYLMQIKDLGFEPLMTLGTPVDYEPVGVLQNKITVTIPDLKAIGTAVFDDPLWTEYTRRCIACGRCNTSCITCSCFTMQDVSYGEGKLGERRRRWAGCHVDGFSDMTGGHSFRKKNGERMRFKTLHKISDFKKRFGFHMCVGCGRCTDVCPEHISFSTAIEKLNQVITEVPKL